MKAIINGKRYDSDTATLIGSAGQKTVRHSDGGDFQGDAEIYTTKSGNYFVRGSGVAGSWASLYEDECEAISEQAPRNVEHIYVMNREQAFAWAQKYLSTRAVEAHFADLIEDA